MVLLNQLLENHIKNELIENTQLVHALPSSEEIKLHVSEPRKSASIACGASVFEVSMKVPTWASQVRFFLTLIPHLYLFIHTQTHPIHVLACVKFFIYII